MHALPNVLLYMVVYRHASCLLILDAAFAVHHKSAEQVCVNSNDPSTMLFSLSCSVSLCCHADGHLGNTKHQADPLS